MRRKSNECRRKLLSNPAGSPKSRKVIGNGILLSRPRDEIKLSLHPSGEERKTLPESHGMSVRFRSWNDFEVANDDGEDHAKHCLSEILTETDPRSYTESDVVGPHGLGLVTIHPTLRNESIRLREDIRLMMNTPRLCRDSGTSGYR